MTTKKSGMDENYIGFGRHSRDRTHFYEAMQKAAKENERILNAGCGSDKYGTDFIDLYPSRKGVIKCNLNTEKFPYGNGTFDEVYAKSVFEHLTNIPHFLSECRRVLKQNGAITIITDNAGLWGLFGGVHNGSYEAHGQHGKEDKHYSLFTKNHLMNWLTDAGFRNVEVKYCIEEENLRGGFGELAVRMLSVSDKLKPNIKAVAFS